MIQTIASTRIDHGGTSRSIPAICDALVRLGCDNHLITGLPADQQVKCNFPADRTRVHTLRESGWLRQWGVGAGFVRHLASLTSGCEANCIVHDHAVWLPTNHAVAVACRQRGIKRVVSPRGMLGTWAMHSGRAKKQIAWNLYQRRDLKCADAFHATSEQEADEIRSLGYRQPIAVIPNGVDFPDTLPPANAHSHRQALFLSRLHPKKGLMLLLQAWKQAAVPESWRLVIAGPDEQGHRHQVEQEVRRLKLEHQVRFTGPVDDEEKWQLYVDSDLFVLPSYNENFGIVIAEAMAAGLPVVTTQGTPWRAIKEERLGWWIKVDRDALATAIKEATSAEAFASLANMGTRAQAFVRSNFSWDRAARELAELYRSLLPARASLPDLY